MENMAKFDSMVFYRSWIKTARDMLDADEASTLVMQLIDYGLDGKTPRKFTSKTAEAIFKMAIPSIDSNCKKKVAGRKGGRGKKAQSNNEGNAKTYGLSNADAYANGNAYADANGNGNANGNAGADAQPPCKSASALRAEPPAREKTVDESGKTVEEWEWHDPEEYISSTATTSSGSPGSKG